MQVLFAAVAAFAPTLALRPTLPALRPSSRLGTPLASAGTSVRCDTLLRDLFAESPTVDAAAVAAACSDGVQWVDMGLPKVAPITGRAAVEEHLAALYPDGSKLVVEKVSDGVSSGGFTWHREAAGAEGKEGLRGITYVELDDAGKISYVQEGYEPLFKLGTALEVIFKLAAKVAKPEDTLAGGDPKGDFEVSTPTTAEGIIRYLWEVAYPGGAEPSEALRFFADDAVYEDLNYPQPFVGIQQITDYINLIPEL